MITFGSLQKKKPYTKRELCSLLASIYDPLGLLSPAVLELKLLMQRTWIDAINQVALAWICSQKNVWKPYVTNCVHEICNLTTPDQWYYLSTSDNPADLLTRTDR
uniref:Uncharacterized protein n=1 Tax=Strigamia maritima TaxID=126957 RepID=T1ILH0_STRMM